ncbi:hypothetical protein ACFL22_00275 [Patescibacteria group bacterium]
MERMPKLNIVESGEDVKPMNVLPVEVLSVLNIEPGSPAELRLDTNIFNFLGGEDDKYFLALHKRLAEGDEELANILINYTKEFEEIPYTNPDTVVQEQVDLGKRTLEAIRTELNKEDQDSHAIAA